LSLVLQHCMILQRGSAMALTTLLLSSPWEKQLRQHRFCRCQRNPPLQRCPKAGGVGSSASAKSGSDYQVSCLSSARQRGGPHFTGIFVPSITQYTEHRGPETRFPEMFHTPVDMQKHLHCCKCHHLPITRLCSLNILRYGLFPDLRVHRRQCRAGPWAVFHGTMTPSFVF